MIQLIDKSDIARLKDISNHTTLDRIDEYIIDAQFNDLKELLGNDFYFDLLSNYQSTAYQKLMNGDTFTVNGCDWTHSGLSKVLAEFAWGRYCYFGSFNDTPNGNVIKNFEFSTPTANSDRKDIWKESKIRANNYFEIIKVYLDNSSFEKWTKGCNNECGENKKGGFKYELIR